MFREGVAVKRRRVKHDAGVETAGKAHAYLFNDNSDYLKQDTCFLLFVSDKTFFFLPFLL